MKLKEFIYKKVNSTNDLAIRIIKKTKYKSGIVIAEYQRKGRGRYGKKWISYSGNLFVTIFFNLQENKMSLNKMSYINCSLVKKLISSYYKKKIIIKKPNDLLVNRKKISGILQEIIKKDEKKYMIVGIGINLIKNPNIKNYPSTNLMEISNKKIIKKKIIVKLKKIYENFLSKLTPYTRNKAL